MLNDGIDHPFIPTESGALLFSLTGLSSVYDFGAYVCAPSVSKVVVKSFLAFTLHWSFKELPTCLAPKHTNHIVFFGCAGPFPVPAADIRHCQLKRYFHDLFAFIQTL